MANDSISSPDKKRVAPQPASPAPVRVRLNLTISEMLYDKYAEQAIKNGRACAEDEILERLTRFQEHDDIGYLSFDARQKAELERAMGRASITPDIVLAQLKNAVTLKVDAVTIELPPTLQQRLRSRVFRGQTYEGNLKRDIVHALRVVAGLEPA